MNDLISVIVPFYNTPRNSFMNCINSIIKQTYTNLEVLIINDGSDTQYNELLKEVELLDNRIVVDTLDNNCGLPYVRNYALKICRGIYSIFVDSDDLLNYNTIYNLYSQIVRNNADIVIGELTIISKYELADLNNNYNEDVYVYNIKEVAENVLTNKIGSTGCCKLAKTDFWNSINNGKPFKENMLHEDLASIMDIICCAHSIIYVKGHNYYYYKGNNSAIHSKLVSEKFCRDFLIALKNRNEHANTIFTDFDEIVSYSYLINIIVIYRFCNMMSDDDMKQKLFAELIELFNYNFKRGIKYSKKSLKKVVLIILFKVSPVLYIVLCKLKGFMLGIVY